MPKRNSRKRRSGTRYPVLLLLLLAAVAGGALLYPLTHPRTHSVNVSRALPTPTTSLAAQTPQPTPTAESSTEPSASPSAVPTQSPQSSNGEHRLAIIIDDCGQWPKTERALIALPIPITMSVMPKERYTQAIAEEAASAGKGVMLHLPMEPVARIDPGRGKITTAMSDEQIISQVKEDVADVPLAKGVNNHEGSKASADSRVMHAVASVLAPDGLFFIDSRTSGNSVAAQVAASAGMQTASRDVFLDNTDDIAAVETMLRHAADIAAQNGSAIAIGHPRAATLEAIRTLIPELQAQGISFALASDLVR